MDYLVPLLFLYMFATTCTCTTFRSQLLPMKSIVTASECKFDIPAHPIFPFSTRLISAARPDTTYGLGRPTISANNMCTVWNWKLPDNMQPSDYNCTLLLAMPEPEAEDANLFAFKGPGNFKIIDYAFNTSLTSDYTYAKQPPFRHGENQSEITLSLGKAYSLVEMPCTQFAPQGTASGRVCSNDTTLSFTQTERRNGSSRGCPTGFFVAVT